MTPTALTLGDLVKKVLVGGVGSKKLQIRIGFQSLGVFEAAGDCLAKGRQGLIGIIALWRLVICRRELQRVRRYGGGAQGQTAGCLGSKNMNLANAPIMAKAMPDAPIRGSVDPMCVTMCASAAQTAAVAQKPRKRPVPTRRATGVADASKLMQLTTT